MANDSDESSDDEGSITNKIITWELVKGATKRAGDHLTNSGGYSYVLLRKAKAEGVCYWRCTKRNSANCKARVTQRGREFIPGKVEHVCVPTVGATAVARVRAACNLKAKEHQSQAARRIVDEVGTHNTNIENYDEYILVERLFIFDIIFTYNYIQNVYLS